MVDAVQGVAQLLAVEGHPRRTGEHLHAQFGRLGGDGVVRRHHQVDGGQVRDLAVALQGEADPLLVPLGVDEQGDGAAREQHGALIELGLEQGIPVVDVHVVGPHRKGDDLAPLLAHPVEQGDELHVAVGGLGKGALEFGEDLRREHEGAQAEQVVVHLARLFDQPGDAVAVEQHRVVLANEGDIVHLHHPAGGKRAPPAGLEQFVVVGGHVALVREDDAELGADMFAAEQHRPGQPPVQVDVANEPDVHPEGAAVAKMVLDHLGAVAGDDDDLTDVELVAHQLDDALQVGDAIDRQHALGQVGRVGPYPGAQARCRDQADQPPGHVSGLPGRASGRSGRGSTCI